MTMRKVLAALAGKVRRLTSGLREKPDVQIDDYVLEHFLLYNGLIGSIPDNQPEYRDVRNDIVQAINDNSAHQLSIALKLSPLWWESRLEKIFAEIANVNKEGAINCLTAQRPVDDFTGDTTPLSHSHWQVRANAARMLAFLDVKSAIPQLIEILHECNGPQKAAFCHIAYSIAKLGTEQGRTALLKHIDNEEPWFRVDAAGSLAHWNLASVATDIMKAMLIDNDLDDYMAVAITRRYSPAAIAEFNDEGIHEGVAQLVLSIMKGLQGPFHSESQLRPQLEEVNERLNQIARQKPTPRRLCAAITLNRWMEEQSNSTTNNSLMRDLSEQSHYTAVKETLSQAITTSSSEIGQIKHALSLTSQFKITEMSPHLVPLVRDDFPALVELFGSIASLGLTETAPAIVTIISKNLNVDERCTQPFSAHPVFEADKASADLYWHGLKALGSLPHKASLAFLSKAVNDYAPDKREQALLSLQTILLCDELKKEYAGNLQDLITERLNDPSISVRTAALQGVAQHKLTELMPDLLKALQSREATISRKASETLVLLANNGCKNEVLQALSTILNKEMDSTRKQRITKIMQLIQ